MNRFDMFKGRKNKKGRVKKLRSVGHLHYDKLSDLCEIKINGLERSDYILEPEKDINATHDYVIYYENLENEDLEPVGVGYLLHRPNAGLIRLEWNFLGTSKIYIDLSRNRFCETAQVFA